MTHTETLNHFLAQYGRRINVSLGLKNGVCALVGDKQRELVVIELPPESEHVLLHSKMKSLKKAVSEQHLKTLLALNFEMNAMRGCWLALDADDNLRLCSQQPLPQLDADHFAQYLDGFLTQAEEVRAFIEEISSAV